MTDAVVIPLPVPEAAPEQKAARSFDVKALIPAGFVLGTVVALGAANGGYFPSAWGWSALVFSWTAVLSLLLRARIRVSRAEIVFVLALTTLLGWTALTLLWSPSTTQTMYEVERTFSYVMFALAFALVTRRRHVASVLGGLLIAITLLGAYALATRLLPGRITTFEPIAGYRLSTPLGYWNALAALCAFGALLALGLVARAGRPVTRGLAAASLVVLMPTLFFTFGRGGWVALFAGLGVIVALDPKRLQFLAFALVAAPWPVTALWRCYVSNGLKTDFSPLATATNDGKSLAWTLVVLAVAAFGVTTLVAVLTKDISFEPWVRRAFAGALVVVALVAVVGALNRVGGPSEAIDRAHDSLRRPATYSSDQAKRLFSLSPTGRFDQWRVALDEAGDYPVVGYGAGGYERYYLEHRINAGKVRDAHNLYLETLGDLGLVGLALLLLALGVPLVVAVRIRRDPHVPIACGCYVAFLVHAALDWDWEMPVLTVTALAFAGCVLICGRSSRRVLAIRGHNRRDMIGALVVLAVLSFAVATGNRALGQANRAADAGNTRSAIDHAQTAAAWAPWSSEPVKIEADARLTQGRLAAARRLYAAAIEKDPENWELWLGLGLASSGKAQKAALDHARSLNPLSPELQELAEHAEKTS